MDTIPGAGATIGFLKENNHWYLYSLSGNLRLSDLSLRQNPLRVTIKFLKTQPLLNII